MLRRDAARHFRYERVCKSKTDRVTLTMGPKCVRHGNASAKCGATAVLLRYTAAIYIINFACELCNHNANNKSVVLFFSSARFISRPNVVLFQDILVPYRFPRTSDKFLTIFCFSYVISGETMTVPDIYGLGNSLSQLNAVSPSHHNASINNSFGSVGGITPNSSIGATTPQLINANMQNIPFSQLTPTSMSSSSFGTPAKNFDSLQVIHRPKVVSPIRHDRYKYINGWASRQGCVGLTRHCFDTTSPKIIIWTPFWLPSAKSVHKVTQWEKSAARWRSINLIRFRNV